MATMHHRDRAPLGQSLLKEGILTENQLRYALQLQQDSQSMKRLGEILVEMGYITKRQLREIARKYNYRLQLGALLVENGAVGEQDLQQALADQAQEGRPLGEMLIERGVLTDEDLARALSQQLDFPYVLPNKRLVDMQALGRIPENVIREHIFLPIFSDGEAAAILVHDPFNPVLTQFLAAKFPGGYELSVAPRGMLEKTVREVMTERSLLGQGMGRGEDEADLGGAGAFRRYDLAREAPGSGQVTGVVDYILGSAIDERASDIHIECLYNKVRVRFRIDGALVFRTDLPKAMAEALTRRIKILARMDLQSSPTIQDGHIYVKTADHNIDLRVSVYPTVLGNSITIRVLTKELGLKDVADLGILPRSFRMLKEFLDAPAGMILFSGPTGSGKTTSLYACLNYLNENRVKICTLESPVEYSIEGIAQCQLQGEGEERIADMVKGMMHQDPDVIVLGEITNDATAAAAVQAALSGHKVFSTIHTDDAVGAVLKLMEPGLRTYLLSSTGLMVFSQRLVRLICPGCKEPHMPDRDLVRQFRIEDSDPDELEFHHGAGCSQCNGSGFLQRSGVFEMLAMNDAVRNAFVDGQGSSVLRRLAKEHRQYVSLREAVFLKALQGHTTLEEAYKILSYSEKQSHADLGLSQADFEYWTGLAAKA